MEKGKHMLRIYIVRHGETLFNVQNKIQGWCDSPLTEKGIRQAKAVGKGLKMIPFVSCYCSTSERVMDTAQLILEGRDVPIYPTKKLKELNFGSIEGDSEEKLFSLGFEKMAEGFVDLGGETMNMLLKRVMSALEEIRQNTPDGNVLVVSHGGAIITLLSSLDAKVREGLMDAANPRGVENCSVSILVDKKGEWVVEEAGNTAYRDCYETEDACE